MSTVLLATAGAALTIGTAAAIEAAILIGRANLLLNHAEQLQQAAARLLARVPSTSAPRTDAPAGQQPHRWWQKLRDLDTPPGVPGPDVQRLDTDYDPRPATRPTPTPGPATVPAAAAIDTWQRTHIPARPPVDAADQALARFKYANGHRA